MKKFSPMKFIVTSILCLFLVAANAQSSAPDPNAPYMKTDKFPSFSLMSVNGKEITNKQLPNKYRYICIVIFSPDCQHCEHEAGEINKYADKFKNTLFIWDSYRDMDAIKKFAEKFNLVNKPNVIIGRDAEFTLPSFFRPRMTPFMAIYDNGHLIKVYEQGADIFELIKLIGSK